MKSSTRPTPAPAAPDAGDEQMLVQPLPETSVRPPRFPLDRVVALIGLLLVALILLAPATPIGGLAIFSGWLLVTGWAIVARLGVRDSPARAAFVVVAGLVVAAVASLVMVWTTFWHPTGAAVILLLAASAVLGVFPRRDDRGVGELVAGLVSRARDALRQTDAVGAILWSTLAVAIIGWVVALVLSSPADLAEVGRLFVFPFLWYASLALTFAVCLVTLTTRLFSPGRATVAIGMLNVMLYGSSAIVQSTPLLPWAYKHVAVSNYIDQAGRVDPEIDIYNRWPGFFSTTAFFGNISGYPDALSWAGWSEAGFGLLDALLVFCIARVITRSATIPWIAATAFTIINWIGQNYFSPQAFVYALYLAMCLIAVTYLRGDPVRLFTALEGKLLAVRRLLPGGRAAAERRLEAPPTAPDDRRTSVTVVAGVALLALQAVVVVSHQLTPYFAIICLVPLFVARLLRPWWVGVGLVALALAFLLPNFDYIDNRFGILSGFDVVSNATSAASTVVEPTPEDVWYQRGAGLLGAVTVVLAGLGFVRQALTGDLRTALLVGWFAFAPVVILFGQSYGGEGRLRVLLFALPWFAIGIGWLFASTRPRALKRGVLRTGALCVMFALFVLTFFLPIEGNRVDPDDAVAAKWLDAQLTRGDLLMGNLRTFPSLIGANYPELLDQGGQSYFLNEFYDGLTTDTTAADIEAVVSSSGGAGHTWLVFADSQKLLLPPGQAEATESLERSVVADVDFVPAYQSESVRIYRIQAPGGALAIDAFERSVNDGWGTADTGPWSLGGDRARFDVQEGAGLVTLAEPGSNAGATLDTAPASGIDLRAELSWDRTGVEGPIDTSLLLRRTDDQSDYRLRIITDESSRLQLQLVARSGGVDTVVAEGPAGTRVLVGGARYTVAARVLTTEDGETSLSAKLWLSGAVEPDWQVDAVDSTPALQEGGGVGITATQAPDASAPITVRLHDLLVEQIVP